MDQVGIKIVGSTLEGTLGSAGVRQVRHGSGPESVNASRVLYRGPVDYNNIK